MAWKTEGLLSLLQRGRVVTAWELTSREEEVLFAIADGRLNKEIAAELVVSVETVKSHVCSLYAKLGARNRAHAVALAYHRGILTVPT